MQPTDTATNTTTSGATSDKQYCDQCDKPLGATTPTCFDCGGTADPGDRITNERWGVLLGAI